MIAIALSRRLEPFDKTFQNVMLDHCFPYQELAREIWLLKFEN